MATVPLEHVANEGTWKLPSRGVVAMASLITAEASIFTIFVVAYLYYLGRDTVGPTPKEVLEIPYLRNGVPALEQRIHHAGGACD